MRFALAFALTLAVTGFFAILVTEYLAREAAGLYEYVTDKITEAER